MIFITIAVMFIGINILFMVFSGSGIVDSVFDAMSKFVRSIFSGRAYNICEGFYGKDLTLEEFQSLLQAMDKEECGLAQVRIRFTLTENDLKRAVNVIGSDRTLLILQGAAKPLGANSILVYGNPGPRPLKRDDRLELRRAGTPRPDIMITLLEPGCDPADDDCDASCSFKSGVCDPVCYKNPNDAPCDIDCVDENNDGIPDFDDICDLDCYDNDPDPGNAYDPDCIKARPSNDNVCDPDSNGVQDSICDPDCASQNSICDPDCDGNGRPYDRECFECDKICNNFCSRVCIAGDDPDCINGYDQGRTACCGNNKCEQGESCSNCKDCPPGTTCAGLYTGKIPQGKDAICCPSAGSDEYGCGIYDVNLVEGAACNCDQQCQQAPPLKCQQSTDPSLGKFCCPGGKQWDGTQCIAPKLFDIVYAPLNFQASEYGTFKSAAQDAFNHWLSESPFRECNDRIKAHFAEITDCPSSGSCGTSGVTAACQTCPNMAVDCAINYWKREFGTSSGFEKVAGISKAPWPSGVFTISGCGPWGERCGDIYEGIGSATVYTQTGTVSHEVGHTLTLCHECGLARPIDCPNKDVSDNRYIMCYGPKEFFSTDSYNYLKGTLSCGSGLKSSTAKILEGC